MEFLRIDTYRLPFADGDKRSCLEEVKRLTRAQYLAVKHGLLALEKAAGEEGASPFLRACVEDVLDGRAPEELRERFARRLSEEDSWGADYLCRGLDAEGLLLAARGADRGELAKGLSRWFGDGWQELIAHTVQAEWERIAPRADPRERSGWPGFDRLLELPPRHRDALVNGHVQREPLWPDETLALALRDAGETVRAYLLEGFSPENRALMEQALKCEWLSWPEDREAAQRELAREAFGGEASL